MIVNGVDLDGLAHETDTLTFPDPVPGRCVHIDADFLAYQVSYESDTSTKTFDDMQHNAEMATETLRLLAGASHVHLHLTPSTSNKGGRFDHALLKEYQGNRLDKPKPRYLGIMREWLAQKFPGTLHETCEADDGMSSMQYAAVANGRKNFSIIASKDKDLTMVPGLHLDWDKGIIRETDEFGHIEIVIKSGGKKLVGLGQKYFWAQMLMGDGADNISGLPRITGKVANKIRPTKEIEKALDIIASGEVGTPKYLKAKSTLATRPSLAVGPVMAYDLLDAVNSNRVAFEVVKNLYRDYGETIGFTHWKTGEPVHWSKAFTSEAQLLWMRRNKEDPNCVFKWFKEIHEVH